MATRKTKKKLTAAQRKTNRLALEQASIRPPALERRCRDPRNLSIVNDPDFLRYVECCRDVTPQEICLYLYYLRQWTKEVTKEMQKVNFNCLKGLCPAGSGPGGGVPAEPPPWPPR